MSFFSWGEKEESNLVGLIAVGSAGVEVASVKNGNIIFSAKKELSNYSQDNITNFYQAICSGLTAILDELQKNPSEKPKSFYCILPSPLFVNAVKTLEIIETQPFIVTQKLIEQTIEKSVKNFLADKPILFTQFTDDSNRLIENDIFYFEVNGYRLENYLGVKTKNLKLVHSISYGSNKILTEIEKTIKSATQQEEIYFNTFPVAAFRSIDALIGQDRDDYLIIDAGGEFTDIAVVHDRSLVTHFSFPYGFNSMCQNLAKNLNTTPSETISTMKLYFQNKLTDEARGEFETVTAKEKEIWLKYFLEAFKTISATTFIFPTTFIFGDEFSTLFVQDFLKDHSLQGLVINKSDFRLSTATALLNSLSIKIKMVPSASPFINLIAPIFSHKK